MAQRLQWPALMRTMTHERRALWLGAIARTTATAALIAGVCACSDAASDPEAASALELPARQILEQHQAQREFPGAVMALHDPALGSALVTTGTTRPDAASAPVDTNVPWVIGSATKMFVAVVVLQLAEEGKLDLDASIEPYFPDLPRAADITPRELLQHTSGLNEYNDLPVVLADAQRFWSAQEIVAVAVARGPVAEPGAGHYYANTNYILLGELIEQLTGHPWYAEVRERILKPLGMPHTDYVGEAHALRTGPGFSIEDGQFVETTTSMDASLGGAAGAMQSTAPDLLRFARALEDGTLLDARRQTEMRSFVPAEPRGYVGHEYGLGFEKYVVRDVTLYGHAGTAPAHASFVGFDADTGLAVAVTINSSEPAPAPTMALEIIAAVANKDIRPPEDAAALPTARE
jgi:D-alanyl-D-alanine carboxypeptidase